MRPLQKPYIIKGCPKQTLTKEDALREYARMVNTRQIEALEKILSDDFCYDSQKSLETLNKQKYIDFINTKLEEISKSELTIFAEMGRVEFFKGNIDPCVILAHPDKDDLVGFVLAKVEDDKLIKLDFCSVPPPQSAMRTGEYPS